MEYHRLVLTPESDHWEMKFSRIPGSREEVGPIINPLGWIIYPSHWSKEIALDRLKKEMIIRHEQEIENLKASLTALHELSFPEGE